MQNHRLGPPETKTVLVVDDDLLVRLIIARILKQSGYRVWEAASAAATLVLLTSTPSKPDLIVSDICMPRMDGLDLALEVRRSWPELPIVLMSGHEPGSMLAGQPRLTGTPFLTKPFSPAQLLEVVDLVLTQTHAVSAV